MSVSVQVSMAIDRPVEEVFDFHAREHVHNHPRWDPDMHLEQVSGGPIGVGTIIHRRHNRTGTLVEGTMEVVEFEPNRAMGLVIHDGSVEMHARATYKAAGQNQTTLTISVEFPSMDESTDTSLLTSMMERSARNIKQLIESEA